MVEVTAHIAVRTAVTAVRAVAVAVVFFFGGAFRHRVGCAFALAHRRRARHASPRLASPPLAQMGRTPLMMAAIAGQEDVTKYLVKKNKKFNVDVDAQDLVSGGSS